MPADYEMHSYVEITKSQWDQLGPPRKAWETGK